MSDDYKALAARIETTLETNRRLRSELNRITMDILLRRDQEHEGEVKGERSSGS